MKVEIIAREQTITVDLNAPVIEVSARPDAFTVNLIGGVGPQGPRGYSPVRGLDYWTEDDIAFIQRTAIDAVLAVYPAAEGAQW